LVAIDYKGIKVDKRSNCEGIWLNAGKLETVSRLEKKALKSCSACSKDRKIECRM
jgi:Zn-finger nucleic acid-binding protein